MRSANIGENQYCGPAVLSILTGKSTDECARILIYVTGRQVITKIHLSELKKALDRMRYEYKETAVDCSLYSLFIQIAKEPGFYIVSLPSHVVAIEVDSENKVWFNDNHTREPINGAASARLSQRCNVTYKVTPKPEPKWLRDDLEVLVGKRGFSGENGEQLAVYITMWSVYENEEDNSRREIGTLYLKDRAELKAIRDELLRKV